MDYIDLTVHISPGADGGYRVRIASDQGTVSSALTLPFTLSDLTGVVIGIDRASRNLHTADTPVVGTTSVKSAQALGEELFEALFGEDAKIKMAETRTAARYTNSGMRIRLSMDLQGHGMAEVASLPWELMCPGDELPLATSTLTPLVRTLELSLPADPRPFAPPLRILAVMSNPQGSPPLKLDEERTRIEQSWARLPSVSVDFLSRGNPAGRRPTRADLRRQLAELDYHVIHFMGHGDADAERGGVLLFEDEAGEPDLVSAKELAMWLRDEPLRLVFLNACKTATTVPRTGVHPFTGVATSLIAAGVPAVVAMQFPISDTAAVDFAQTFYERIAQRIPVDAAVAEGRKAIYSETHAEWATPVLFLRSKDGVLFQPAGTVAPINTPGGQSQNAAAVNAVDADPWGPGQGDRVFLATPDQNLASRHKGLMRDLVAEGVRVVTLVPPPDDAKAHAAAVDALVRRADLCVHLLGEAPGQRIDDAADALLTYPLEQLRIGLDAAHAQLVLMTDGDKKSISDATYAAKVRELEELPRDRSRFELVMIDRNQMKAQVLEKLRALAAARTAASPHIATAGTPRSAFVDSHRKDLQFAQALEGHLADRNIEVLKQTRSTSPTEALTQFDVNLSKFPLYIVVSGGAEKDWVDNRLNAAVKSALEQDAKAIIGVFAPQAAGGAVRLSMPQFKVRYNGTDADTSSEDALLGPGDKEGA